MDRRQMFRAAVGVIAAAAGLRGAAKVAAPEACVTVVMHVPYKSVVIPVGGFSVETQNSWGREWDELSEVSIKRAA
jgi:hypothetical protein